MKILFVAANTRAQGEPTLGLGYIASYLRKYVDQDLDIRILNYIPKDISRIISFSPDIIGISAMTKQYTAAVRFAARLKQHINTPIIIGGVHITLAPDSFNSAFDLAVMGEGEQTFLEIIQCVLLYGFDKGHLKEIRGVMLDYEGNILESRPRDFIRPLDTIPHPARDLFNMEFMFNPEKPFFGHTKGRGTQMFTSRGCPYKCVFCSCSAVWGKPRFHSAEYVVEEMSLLIERYGVKHIRIHDDLFTVNVTRLRKLVTLMEERGIPEKVSFAVFGRADTLNEEICALLKRMNTEFIEFGMESGSQRILDILKCGLVKLHHLENAVRLCRKFKLSVGGFFILGTPGETEDEMLQTLNFIRKLQLDKFFSSVCTPLPGTTLWNRSVGNGLISGDMLHIDWDTLSGLGKGIMAIDDIMPGGDLIYMNKAVPPERFVEIYNLIEEERMKTATPNWAEIFPEEDPGEQMLLSRPSGSYNKTN